MARVAALSLVSLLVCVQGLKNVSRVPWTFLTSKMRDNYERRQWNVKDRGCDKYIYSRKFKRGCTPYPYEMLPLLITGSGGVGTRVVTELLRSMGLDASHEKYDYHATVSWTHAINDFTFGIPYPFSSERTKWWLERKIRNRVDFENVFKPRFQHVIHLTRCPLKVLRTMLRPHAPVIRFVEKATRFPSITSPCAEAYDCETDLAERVGWATSMYVAWNEHIERYADERLQIEAFGHDAQNTFALSRRLCDLALALKRKGLKFESCRERVHRITNSTIPRLLAIGDADSAPPLLTLRHLREAKYAPGVDRDETVKAFVAMATRYGYEQPCVSGGETHQKLSLYWSSRMHEIINHPPTIETLSSQITTKAGVESCLTTDDECSMVQRRCPNVPADRDCLRARIPFRVPYRRLKCCFQCCVLYWLKTTRLYDNMRFHVKHADELVGDIGYHKFNPDSGDFGLDPYTNLLLHPHAFSLISDVHIHPKRGCHVPLRDHSNISTTIASMYHHKPDVTMVPFDGRGHLLRLRKDPWINNKEFGPCVKQLRRAKHLVVDVFDPAKHQPGPHLAHHLALFTANNVADEPPVNSTQHRFPSEQVRERPIGVRGVSLWQAILEHPNLDHVPQRESLLLCCCMNVDGMHKGRMEHTKLLAKHPVFNCPLDDKYRGHHIGTPKNDPGVHEIEAEFILMLNERYGNRKGMNGNFDSHMPILMRAHKFVYSPNGVGEQCYREYEALVSGAIPVLDDSAYKHRHAMLTSLPTIRVPNGNWSLITPEFLERRWLEMERRDFDVSKLYLPYWYDAFLSAMAESEVRNRGSANDDNHGI